MASVSYTCLQLFTTNKVEFQSPTLLSIQHDCFACVKFILLALAKDCELKSRSQPAIANLAGFVQCQHAHLQRLVVFVVDVVGAAMPDNSIQGLAARLHGALAESHQLDNQKRRTCLKHQFSLSGRRRSTDLFVQRQQGKKSSSRQSLSGVSNQMRQHVTEMNSRTNLVVNKQTSAQDGGVPNPTPAFVSIAVTPTTKSTKQYASSKSFWRLHLQGEAPLPEFELSLTCQRRTHCKKRRKNVHYSPHSCTIDRWSSNLHLDFRSDPCTACRSYRDCLSHKAATTTIVQFFWAGPHAPVVVDPVVVVVPEPLSRAALFFVSCCPEPLLFLFFQSSQARRLSLVSRSCFCIPCAKASSTAPSPAIGTYVRRPVHDQARHRDGVHNVCQEHDGAAAATVIHDACIERDSAVGIRRAAEPTDCTVGSDSVTRMPAGFYAIQGTGSLHSSCCQHVHGGLVCVDPKTPG